MMMLTPKSFKKNKCCVCEKPFIPKSMGQITCGSFHCWDTNNTNKRNEKYQKNKNLKLLREKLLKKMPNYKAK